MTKFVTSHKDFKGGTEKNEQTNVLEEFEVVRDELLEMIQKGEENILIPMVEQVFPCR